LREFLPPNSFIALALSPYLNYALVDLKIQNFLKIRRRNQKAEARKQKPTRQGPPLPALPRGRRSRREARRRGGRRARGARGRSTRRRAAREGLLLLDHCVRQTYMGNLHTGSRSTPRHCLSYRARHRPLPQPERHLRRTDTQPDYPHLFWPHPTYPPR